MLIDIASAKEWTILIAEKVISESTKKQELDVIIKSHIDKGNIKEVHCNPATFNRLRTHHGNLGDGELESIAIAIDCVDKLTAPYVIFSDDKKARNQAIALGINSFDILAFFVIANRSGILTKSMIIRYIDNLSKNNYSVRQDVYALLLKQIQ